MPTLPDTSSTPWLAATAAGHPAVLGGDPVFREFVPLVRPWLPDPTDALLQAVRQMVSTGALTKGARLTEFERRAAEYLGVRHAVAVSSCTLGLMLTYQGLGLQREVIVPSFTFMATAHPLRWVGARPVWVDIDPETWNIDPAAIEAAITPRTSAIVAVHNFGNPADVDRLQAIADRHGLPLIFDAAHGFGARYRGRPVGGFGRAEIFSLSPTKLLIAGEGGLVTTDDDELARHIRVGREYGNPGTYGSEFPGLNARMAEFNAMLGTLGLDMVEQAVRRRNEVVARMQARLSSVRGLAFQRIHSNDRCAYKDLSIVVDERRFGLTRDQLATSLKAEGIDTRRYHYPAVHTHAAYRDLPPAPAGTLAVTCEIAARSLSLPIWSHMPDEVVDGICAAIERLHGAAEAVRRVVGVEGQLS